MASTSGKAGSAPGGGERGGAGTYSTSLSGDCNGGSTLSTLTLRRSLEGSLTFRRGLFFVACVSFFAVPTSSLGGGAEELESGDAAMGLYIVLDELSLFRKALNFSFPSRASISSKEVSWSWTGDGGGSDIFIF